MYCLLLISLDAKLALKVRLRKRTGIDLQTTMKTTKEQANYTESLKSSDIDIVEETDVESLDLVELNKLKTETLQLMESLDEQIVRIDTQLRAAQTEHHMTGNYADPKWYNAARAAKAHKGREKQQLQHRLAKLNLILKKKSRTAVATKTVSDAEAFKKAAKTLLREETYLKICKLADTISSGGIE